MTDSGNAVTPPVGGALSDIAKKISETRFTLQTDDAADGRRLLGSLSSEMDDFILPRINRAPAPFLIAVGGSTGAGKSTLVNSLIGRTVSPAGVRRPTTANPIVIHNPADAKHFETATFLGDLPRRPAPETPPPAPVLLPDAATAPGTAVLDCPDIDSIAESNRDLARRILMCADLWLFVTTANRYADAAPWALLREAAARSTSVALVLDRVPPEANREVRHHLSHLLSEAGLAQSPIFSVAELPLEDGRLPHAAVYPIQSWIREVSAESESRGRIRRRTLSGAIASLPGRVDALAEAAQSQEDAHAHLERIVDERFRSAHESLATVVTDGRILHGAVNARWQDFVGTGQLFRGLEPTMARMRDRISAAVTGKHDAAAPLHIAILRSAAITLREAAVDVVDVVADDWRRTPAGEALVTSEPALREPTSELEDRVKAAVSGWSNDVNALVRDIGQGKKSKARILSFGVSGVCAVLEYATFWDPAHTSSNDSASRSGAGVALSLAGTIFGEQEAVDIIGSIRDRFLTAAAGIIGDCRTPFDQALRLTAVPTRQSGALRTAGARLEEAL